MKGSPTDLFVSELGGELLRRKMVLPKRRVQKLKVTLLPASQTRLVPVNVSRRLLDREAIFRRNLELLMSRFVLMWRRTRGVGGVLLEP